MTITATFRRRNVRSFYNNHVILNSMLVKPLPTFCRARFWHIDMLFAIDIFCDCNWRFWKCASQRYYIHLQDVTTSNKIQNPALCLSVVVFVKQAVTQTHAADVKRCLYVDCGHRRQVHLFLTEIKFCFMKRTAFRRVVFCLQNRCRIDQGCESYGHNALSLSQLVSYVCLLEWLQ